MNVAKAFGPQIPTTILKGHGHEKGGGGGELASCEANLEFAQELLTHVSGGHVQGGIGPHPLCTPGTLLFDMPRSLHIHSHQVVGGGNTL